MSLIKGRVSDISDDFLDKLEKFFPLEGALYHPDTQETHADLAYSAGQQSIIKWIKRHAIKTTSTG